MKKFHEDYEKWENSIEGILHELEYFGDTLYRNHFLIAETLLELPKDVREKVLQEVVFILMEDLYGTIVNGYFTKRIKKDDIKRFSEYGFVQVKQPLILLNFHLMKKATKREKMSTVAHEIAHFILGHHNIENSYNPMNEKAADNLAEKWGFKRAYEDYKQFEKLAKIIKDKAK